MNDDPDLERSKSEEAPARILDTGCLLVLFLGMAIAIALAMVTTAIKG